MKYPFVLPQLSYLYETLEPHINAKTMEIHHTKHHQVYVDKLNAAMEKWPEGQAIELEEILKNLDIVPEAIRSAVRNHGGGHYNHSLFWQMIIPPANKGFEEPQGALINAIETNFSNFVKFKELFTVTALDVFGSGWAWLVRSNNEQATGSQELKIIATPNQDTPLAQGFTPILGLDVWEHAYYLKYQNRRKEYIENWWNVVNWKWVGERLT